MSIGHDRKILIVDDSGTVRSIVRRILAQSGYANIDEASDGDAALAKIREGHYALVISDWNMQPMNGQELLEQLRKDEQYSNLPFIMMTAEPVTSKLVQARDSGVSSFICKPFSAEALQTKLSQLDAR